MYMQNILLACLHALAGGTPLLARRNTLLRHLQGAMARSRLRSGATTAGTTDASRLQGTAASSITSGKPSQGHGYVGSIVTSRPVTDMMAHGSRSLASHSSSHSGTFLRLLPTLPEGTAFAPQPLHAHHSPSIVPRSSEPPLEDMAEAAACMLPAGHAPAAAHANEHADGHRHGHGCNATAVAVAAGSARTIGVEERDSADLVLFKPDSDHALLEKALWPARGLTSDVPGTGRMDLDYERGLSSDEQQEPAHQARVYGSSPAAAFTEPDPLHAFMRQKCSIPVSVGSSRGGGKVVSNTVAAVQQGSLTPELGVAKVLPP